MGKKIASGQMLIGGL